MKIALSVPTGYHIRELLLPLAGFLEMDTEIDSVVCITPAARWREQVFPSYGTKFTFVENPLDMSGPDVVVTTTSGLDPNDVQILAAAKRSGIPTVTFIASWDNVWKMERSQQIKRPQVVADRLIVWNEMMKNHLLRIFPALRTDHIAVIGAPRFDFFWHTDRIPTAREVRHHLGITPDDKPLIHVATTELYPMDYLMKAISRAIQRGEIERGTHVYASVHPGGAMRKYESYAQRYGVTVRYSFGRHSSSPHPDFLYNPSLEEIYLLVALFKYSALLINHSSTVALESMAGDVPIINVKYGRPLDWWRWYRSMVYRDFQQHYRDIVSGGATTIVKSKRQLLAAINRYSSHPEYERQQRRETLKKMITTTDGTASAKVLEYIKSVAK